MENTDIKQVLPEEDIEGIPFRDKKGNVYLLPPDLPAGVHLRVFDKWEQLLPFMLMMNLKGEDRTSFLEEKKTTIEEVEAVADSAINTILSEMMKPSHPHMTPDWLNHNLSGMEKMGLTMQIIMMASDFFVKRRAQLKMGAKMMAKLSTIANQGR